MSKIISTVFALVLLVSFAQCKKDKTSYSIGFSTNKDSTVSLYLFIDTVSKGRIPFLKNGADGCDDPKALRITLSEGNYVLKAKDSLGTIKVIGTAVLANNEINTTSSQGIVNIVSMNNCAAIELNYW